MQPLAVCLFFALVNLGVSSECLQDWTHFQELCYGFGDTDVSWGDAQAICQSRDGSLAEVTSLQVSNFVSAMARNKTAYCVWLGGSDYFHEGVWEWTSRENNFFRFTNWANGEPNDRNGAEDCLNIFSRLNYTWNDEACNRHCKFICAAAPITTAPNVAIPDAA